MRSIKKSLHYILDKTTFKIWIWIKHEYEFKIIVLAIHFQMFINVNVSKWFKF